MNDSKIQINLTLQFIHREIEDLKNQENPDETFKKWCRWLETILADVQQLLITQEIYQGVSDIYNGNPNLHKPSAFWGWLLNVYVENVSIGIRKQLDVKPPSISLKRLLRAICDHPEVLSRERYITMTRESKMRADLLNREFDRHSGKNQDHIDASKVKEDIDLIEAMAHKVKEFVDKRIAHSDEKAPESLVSIEDINKCLPVYDNLVKKYYSILNRESIDILPIWQYDWKEIFREVWIPETKD